jgi:hypothetical protein
VNCLNLLQAENQLFEETTCYNFTSLYQIYLSTMLRSLGSWFDGYSKDEKRVGSEENFQIRPTRIVSHFLLLQQARHVVRTHILYFRFLPCSLVPHLETESCVLSFIFKKQRLILSS